MTILQKNMSQSPKYSIDESMIKFKSRSSFKQYMPLKLIKRGFKCGVYAIQKQDIYLNSIFIVGSQIIESIWVVLTDTADIPP